MDRVSATLAAITGLVIATLAHAAWAQDLDQLQPLQRPGYLAVRRSVHIHREAVPDNVRIEMLSIRGTQVSGQMRPRPLDNPLGLLPADDGRTLYGIPREVSGDTVAELASAHIEGLWVASPARAQVRRDSDPRREVQRHVDLGWRQGALTLHRVEDRFLDAEGRVVCRRAPLRDEQRYEDPCDPSAQRRQGRIYLRRYGLPTGGALVVVALLAFAVATRRG